MGHSASSDMNPSSFYGQKSRQHVLEEDILPEPDDLADVVVINFGKKYQNIYINVFFAGKCDIFI